MNFEEHAAKPLLAAAGIAIPRGRLARTPDDAADAARALGGRAVVKAQVPAGKRGKAGGIALVASPEEAGQAAARMLGLEIGGHTVESVLVDEQVAIARELYVAVLTDPVSKGPLVMVSAEGGMDIEEIAAKHPDALVRLAVDIRKGLERDVLATALPEIEGIADRELADLVERLYGVYREHDAELVEINPLVLTTGRDLVALDCKFIMDDSALKRCEEVAKAGTPDRLTALEARAKALGLKYIELDGDVGVLANGAGLTMTTMDVIAHLGGRPANFLEIGGEAYTLGRPALEIVLANPGVKSLVVNFCGAFARTDVMTGGLLDAWDAVQPRVPVFFTIHGTGEDEAVAMVRERLGIEPFERMDDAIRAAVEAAR
jgi:succinyl-CoA synthetase beta subunit